MKIAIDAHMVGHRATGNETYTVNLTNALAQMSHPDHEYTVYVDRRELLDSPCLFDGRVKMRRLQMHSPFIRIPFLLPAEVWYRRIDVVHMQYILSPILPHCASVLTVHDISFEHFPDFFSRGDLLRTKLLVPISARRADVVVTVSEYTKKDLVNSYGIDPDKIVVTPEAANSSFRPLAEGAGPNEVRHRYGIAGPFILFVGNIQPRKNLRRLIDAYGALVRDQRIPHRLVIVGNKARLHSHVFQAVRDSGLEERVIFTGYVPNEDLCALYNAAETFVFPSIFEGFGLPIIESMSCGTPVIASNTSSMPEVGGDAVIYVDPYDTGELAAAMHAVLGDCGLRARLSAAGLARAKRFSWENTARRTVEAYELAFERRLASSIKRTGSDRKGTESSSGAGR